MVGQAEAIRRWAASMGEAFLQLARDYGDVGTEPDESEAVVENLGPRQRQLYEALAARSPEEVKTSELATAIDYDLPNTYMALQALERRGVVQMVSGSRPQRWRIVRPRGTSDPYRAAADLVPEGRWTTYGDISIAVRGDLQGARAVASSAAHNPDFPHPERVLKADGIIAPTWRSSEGFGPEECRRRLEEQGVRFDGDRADLAQQMSWQELRNGLRAAGLAVPPDPSE